VCVPTPTDSFVCTQYDNLTTVANLKSLFARDKVKWPELTWVTMDSLTAKGPSSPPVLPQLDPVSVAFLQYTSGIVIRQGYRDSGGRGGVRRA
jgi:hypothetical protein